MFGSSSRSLGGVSPCPCKVTIPFFKFLWCKKTKRRKDEFCVTLTLPQNPSEFHPFHFFLWEVCSGKFWGGVWQCNRKFVFSSFRLFLSLQPIQMRCSIVSVECRKSAPRTSHREAIGKFPIGYRVIPHWIHYRL